MRSRKLVIAAAIATVGLVAAPAASADATTSGQAVGGGYWNGGVDNGRVISNFYHASKYHSSTACNGGLVNPCAKAFAIGGHWSYASIASSFLGGNKTYYNTY